MNKKVLVIVLGISFILTSGCGNVAKLKNGEEIVGKIKGKTITADDLYKDLKKQNGTSSFINMIDSYIANKEVKTTDAIKNEAKTQLEQLKMQYEQSGQDFNVALKNAGYENENSFLDILILDSKKNTVVQNFLKKKVTDEEINDYYEKNITGEITARHILIIPEVNDNMSDEDKDKAKKNAKNKAEDLIKKLNSGSKFETLAKKNSDDEGSKKDGGLITGITKDSVVEPFFNAVKDLKDGEYTKEPVESSYGYHIILRVNQKEKPKLKEVKDDIIENIVTNKISSDANLNTTTWVEIRKKYELNINDSEIKKGYNKTINN